MILEKLFPRRTYIIGENPGQFFTGTFVDLLFYRLYTKNIFTKVRLAEDAYPNKQPFPPEVNSNN